MKAAIGVFVASKARMNPLHEFGLACVTDTCIWVRELLSRMQKFSSDFVYEFPEQTAFYRSVTVIHINFSRGSDECRCRC